MSQCFTYFYNSRKTDTFNQLAIYFGGTDKFLVYAADENNLYATVEFLNIHFNKDEQGNAIGFDLERYGRSDVVKKSIDVRYNLTLIALS